MEFELNLDKIDLGAVSEMRHGRNMAMTLSENTKSMYLLAARQFNEFLQKHDLKVNEDSLTAFFEANKSWSPATSNFKRQALMNIIKNQPGIDESYLKRAQITEIFRENIIRIKNISQAIKEGKYLTEAQVKKLIEKATRRVGLMIKFSFVTGCRVSEMINIRISNVSESRHDYTIKFVGKGSKQGDGFVNKEIMKDIFETFEGKIYLFETVSHEKFDRKYIWREMKKVGEKCKIKVYPHIFRHSYAMHLKKKKMEVDYIQKALRHSDVATTLRFYFHNEPDGRITKCFTV